MFKFFEENKQPKQTEAEPNHFDAIWEADFDDIWKIECKNNMLIALNGWLCRKSNYGENIEKLSDVEKAFYFVFQLEGEVNNGGYSQFFFNSSGDFANETPAALREIGAGKMAEICERALAVFGGAVPKNRDEREAMLDNAITEKIDEILSQCDTEFYAYPDDLLELNYQYVMSNRTQFTR